MLEKHYDLTETEQKKLKQAGIALRYDILNLLEQGDREGLDIVVSALRENDADSAWERGREWQQKAKEKLGAVGKSVIRSVGSIGDAIRGARQSFDAGAKFDVAKSLSKTGTGKKKKDKEKDPKKKKEKEDFCRSKQHTKVKDLMDQARSQGTDAEAEVYDMLKRMGVKDPNKIDGNMELNALNAYVDNNNPEGVDEEEFCQIVFDILNKKKKKDSEKPKQESAEMQSYMNEILRLGLTDKELAETTGAGSIAAAGGGGFGSWSEHEKALKRIEQTGGLGKGEANYGFPIDSGRKQQGILIRR